MATAASAQLTQPATVTNLAELVRQGRADQLAELDRSAFRARTRHRHGVVTWRRWGAGPALLLFHGGTGSWNHWLRTIPDLMRDHTVWVPDLPGMGESDPPATPLSPHDYSAILAEGYRQLTPADEPFDLVTFSMGGELAVPFATICRDRLRRVVLVGSCIARPLTRESLSMRSHHRGMSAAARDEVIRHNFHLVMLHNDAAIDELALAIQHHNFASRRLSRGSLIDHRPLSEVVGDLPPEIGLHLINGACDAVLGGPCGPQREALRALRAEATFQAIPGGSHWVMYDRAAEFNRCLRRALAMTRCGPPARPEQEN